MWLGEQMVISGCTQWRDLSLSEYIFNRTWCSVKDESDFWAMYEGSMLQEIYSCNQSIFRLCKWRKNSNFSMKGTEISSSMIKKT